MTTIAETLKNELLVRVMTQRKLTPIVDGETVTFNFTKYRKGREWLADLARMLTDHIILHGTTTAIVQFLIPTQMAFADYIVGAPEIDSCHHYESKKPWEWFYQSLCFFTPYLTCSEEVGKNTLLCFRWDGSRYHYTVKPDGMTTVRIGIEPPVEEDRDNNTCHEPGANSCDGRMLSASQVHFESR